MARRLPLVLFSVLLHAATFPPWNFSLLSWMALLPFLTALRGMTPGKGLVLGLLWGSAAIWAVAPWVPAALTFYYEQPWWFGIAFCAIGSMILWGTYYSVFACVTCWLRPRSSGLARAVLLSVLWVSCELARARLMTGEPWMLLGYALMPDLPAIQAADVGGVYLLSFAVFFVNACLMETLERLPPARGFFALGRPSVRVSSPTLARFTAAGAVMSAGKPAEGRRRALLPIASALSAVILLHVYGAFRLTQPINEEGAVAVAVIQANNDLGWQWRPEFYGRDLGEYIRLSRRAAENQPVDLFIWPESAVTFFLAHEPYYQRSIDNLLLATGADLLLGAPHRKDVDPAAPSYFNSAFYLKARGGVTGRYDKAHLLPFAEYFPLRFIDFLRRHFERVRTFTPGEGDVLLDTRLGKAAVVICFEAIFPQLVRQQMQRGANVLVNLSNDAWLGPHAGPLQHASMVTLRAVENRTWVIRATTTGVSAIIDPHGRWQAEGGIGSPSVLRARVAPQRVTTAYARWGDAFAYLCLASLFGGGVLCAVRGQATPPAR